MTDPSAYYDDLQGRARGVLIGVAQQLPSQVVALIEELIEHNECGVAVEMLSDALVAGAPNIDPRTMVNIETLVTMMGLDRDVASRLRPLVEVSRGDGE